MKNRLIAPVISRLPRSLPSIAYLYGGKLSTIVVSYFFYPIYSKLVGLAAFGTIAVILSLQAFLVVMDLGMAVILSREFAIRDRRLAHSGLMRAAETALTGFYLVLAVLVLLWMSFGYGGDLPWHTVGVGLLMCWASVLQNLYYTVQIACRDFRHGSSLLLVFALGRSVATVVALQIVEASVTTFVVVQALFYITHALVSRRRCLDLCGAVSGQAVGDWPGLWTASLGLVRRGRPLMLASLAGAAATQLDKPLISMFLGPKALVPYFFALTVCGAIISSLAGPISQFFQPSLLRSDLELFGLDERLLARRYVFSIFSVVAVPCSVLWAFSGQFAALWIGPGETANLLSAYLRILVPGFLIGAMGFVPYALLLFAEEYAFIARAAFAMAAGALTAIAICASLDKMAWVCVVIAIYHASSTVISWMKAVATPRVREVASYSAKVAAALVLLMFSSMLIVSGLLAKG